MSGFKIKSGIDLRIDQSVQNICEISNKSSTSTRAVLYLLVVASMIQLAVVLNTFPHSWNNERKNLLMEKETRIKPLDSFRHKNKVYKVIDGEAKRIYLELEKLEKMESENYTILRIPLINIPVHVNDTGLISGFLLCILFLILIVTLEREEINLCISLKSVTSRYTNNSDKEHFKEVVAKVSSMQKIDKRQVISEINRTRRIYHFNYLTMNEIFTQPNNNLIVLLRDQNEVEYTWKQKVLKNKYWLATIIFMLTLINDLLTYDKGIEKYGIQRTLFHYVIMFITLFIIIYLTIRCQRITENILKRYNDFKKNDYKFILKKKGYCINCAIT